MRVGFNLNCMINAHLKFFGINASIDGFEAPIDNSFFGHIDQANSIWGTKERCQYVIFTPLVEAIFATIWLSIFITCGHGGRGIETMFINPWRIVFPATIFFLIMTICSVAHVAVLFHQLKDLCAQFAATMHHVSPSTDNSDCALLIDYFSPNRMRTEEMLFFSPRYTVMKFSCYIKTAAWTAALSLMLTRIWFAADFQLIRVSIGTSDSDDDAETKFTSTMSQTSSTLNTEMPTTISETSSTSGDNRRLYPIVYFDENDGTLKITMKPRKSQRKRN